MKFHNYLANLCLSITTKKTQKYSKISQNVTSGIRAGVPRMAEGTRSAQITETINSIRGENNSLREQIGRR